MKHDYYIVYEHWNNGLMQDKGTFDISSELPITCFKDVMDIGEYIKDAKELSGTVLVVNWQKYDTA